MSQNAAQQGTPPSATTDRDDARLVLRRTLPAPPATVYDAWTVPERMAPWLAPGEAHATVEADARPGGRYRVTMHNVEGGATVAVGGEYLELEPNRRIVLTWQWEGQDPEPTRITVELAAAGGGTEMVVTHDRFLTTASRDSHRKGWEACFTKLEAVLEG